MNVCLPPMTLPFGKFKGQPLEVVRTDYLLWLLREAKLSSGLRAGIGNELRRRNVDAPTPPPPPKIPACWRCPDAGHVCHWAEDGLGRKRIRASCPHCGRFLTFPPCVPPFTTEADQNASDAPVLDALTQLEGVGIELQSDGRRVWFGGDDYKRVPLALRATVRQCSHLLARMLGDTTKTTEAR